MALGTALYLRTGCHAHPTKWFKLLLIQFAWKYLEMSVSRLVGGGGFCLFLRRGGIGNKQRFSLLYCSRTSVDIQVLHFEICKAILVTYCENPFECPFSVVIWPHPHLQIAWEMLSRSNLWLSYLNVWFLFITHLFIFHLLPQIQTKVLISCVFHCWLNTLGCISNYPCEVQIITSTSVSFPSFPKSSVRAWNNMS